VSQVTSLATETEGARDAIDVLTIALWVFAGVAAVASVVAVAIVGSRQIASEEENQAALASLGLTSRQRAIAAGAVATPAALAGAALAVVVAALSSPLLPIGVAREAEIDPGIRLDGLVLGGGFLAVVVFVLAVAAVSGWRVARSAGRTGSRAEPMRVSAVARGAASAGVPPTVTTGLRMALEPGGGRSAVPVRSAFVGAVLGTVGIVTVLAFSASLDHLAATPRAYGWSFDAVLLSPLDDAQVAHAESVDEGPCRVTNPAIMRDPQLSAVATLCVLDFQVDGRPTTAYGFASLRGSIRPVVVAGRPPHGVDEIVLGASTLDALGKQLGDRVRVRGDTGVEGYRIVGQAVFPSPASLDPQALADGAAFAERGISRLLDPKEGTDTNFVARFADDVDLAKLPRVRDGVLTESALAALPTVPVEIERLEQFDQLPALLGVLLALLATAAVGHAIVLAVRRRRRDLAVLRTLGFERSQVRATILCQATTHAVIGLLVGIPLGIAVGRLVWGAIAESLGVATNVDISVPAQVVLAVGAILVTTVIGSFAARSVIRTSPAAVLRSE
jgi:hypothetical protein